jgi:Arc/MetJ-type ribon-helix-helix transcriptional regulator
MAIIPIKLKEADVSKIDYLVKLGKYRSRNQAILAFIQNSLVQEPINLDEQNPEIETIRTKLFEIWDAQSEFVFSLKNGKSLVDIIANDRER